MKIQILGTGCSNCNKLYELTKEAVGQLNLKEKVEHLTGQESIQKIIEMGVMSSPVLAIDGKAVMTGFIPDIEKIKKLILEAKGK